MSVICPNEFAFFQLNFLTDKKVQHDIRDDDVECAEINQTRREISTIGFPKVGTRCAIWRLNHAIVHNFVPIFAGNDPKQHGDTRDWSAKVGASSNLFAMLYRAEENCAGQSVEKDQQKHSENNEERFADGNGNGEN